MHNFGIRSSWIQPVLMVARREGLLTRDRYNDAVIALIESGDRVLSIDGGVLVAAGGDPARNGYRFDRVVSLLGGPNAEMISHIGVAVAFLGHIWQQRPYELVTARQTGLILENLLRARYDWEQSVEALWRNYRQDFGGDSRLKEYITGWLRGHFLIPAGN
jgi:hypothetical protein